MLGAPRQYNKVELRLQTPLSYTQSLGGSSQQSTEFGVITHLTHNSHQLQNKCHMFLMVSDFLNDTDGIFGITCNCICGFEVGDAVLEMIHGKICSMFYLKTQLTAH